MIGNVGSPTSAVHSPINVNIYGGTFLSLQGLLMEDEKGSKILTWYQSRPNVWIMVKKALFLSSFGRTGKRKKPSLRVMENVGSPALVGNVQIEVNIYGGTFLLYKVVSWEMKEVLKY